MTNRSHTMPAKYTPKNIKHFWKHVNKNGSIPTHRLELGQCWEWTASCHKTSRYGRFKFQGLYRQAHRVSWEIANDQIPDGLFVLHKCDNRKCVNPSHLFLGTHQDNMDDMVAKKRNQKNTFRIVADYTRLTEADVIAMERLCKAWRKAQNETLSI